jgi:four helix bundle protein
MNRFNLEDRLVNYAAEVLKFSRTLPVDYASTHLGKQLIRSGTSAALNYGEAQAGESRADFIHKMKVALKELRESFVCLKILNKNLESTDPMLQAILVETNELISIFVASVKTAQAKGGKM